MRAVIQRVSSCSLFIDDAEYSSIGQGLLVLLGVEDADSMDDIQWLSGKVVRLRLFNDNEGVMNLSVAETGGEIMVVSQFTLHASTKKGNRPSYLRASKPEKAIPMYNSFINQVESDLGKKVATGSFGAHMVIQLVNDGPVTIVIDTKNKE